MKTYAIIKLGGFQYTVEEGKEYTVPKFQSQINTDVVISDVLAVGSGDTILLGKPHVTGAQVVISVKDHEKGEKVSTRIYRAKDRYRKNFGFRKLVTRFSVKAIKADGVVSKPAKTVTKKSEKTAEATKAEKPAKEKKATKSTEKKTTKK